ncbi:tRNA (N(6)-L-threonylcarbamoyladenosine(37)-C(2))-methylthiotransferase MtaB [Flexilinea flocculi]|uniref:MiaB-like tRNA modifying enzyme n=1 Tax=Flexilinea flocculi TaxID=1678840 RepID=A0A0S7BYX3_9CHLR|nr:tRNA (N(6)-L-threonylcarbamoyladenosine(37)-C(2))-methylthiotransferase MtaB [Flexilinea flocculi]GAP41619.1 MiaB-like tRNA modifying enzyme [Flexilinea flocculi]
MKVFFDLIGCRLNQAEIEQYAAQFRSQGHEITGSRENADLIIINTCAVTAAAASDSREKIRIAGNNKKAQIIVTGCWSDMDSETAAALPGVVKIIPNQKKDFLPSIILGISPELFDLEPIKREPLPGVHARTRAFIKVQDGCDNFCTFCVTRLVRGKARSVSFEEILQRIQSVQLADGKEIVLTGVNLGAWGLDLNPRTDLTGLLKRILMETDIPRIRLSSLETWNLTEDFVRLWENPRLCPHFHIPLQSGSESVLKRMARRTRLSDFRELVRQARYLDPAFAITTDVIVGFPGETEQEFQQTLDFIREINFSGGHVFPFSSRPGTAAARMDGKITGRIVKERSRILRDEFLKQKDRFYQSFVGETMRVLWENSSVYENNNWELHGMTGNYLTIKSHFPKRLQNEISEVKIEHYDGKSLTGLIL